jgi:hypothetical protein
VAVDLRYLDPQGGMPPPEVGVELFDGSVLTLDLQRIEQRGAGNYTWHGKVQGYGRSRVTVSVVAGQIAGTIVLVDDASRPSGIYQIQSGADGVPTLRQIDPDGFPPDHPPGTENLRLPRAVVGPALSGAADSAGGSAQTTGTTAAADSSDTIDVMVVYSNQTAAAAGIGIDAQIQQAIDTANAVYANSAIATRLRLVRSEQVNYSESGDFNTDLNWVTNAAGVAALRNAYGADMVSMFVENGQYCGMAWVGPSANSAFSVVSRGCASGNYSFPHELGHNFGARHDTYVDASASPYAYGHGITDASGGWRDVMAYNNACAAVGTSCTRIAYLSNPNLSYGNPPHPLGTTSTSDVVRVHNQNAPTVANFRAAATGGCTYTLSPTSLEYGFQRRLADRGRRLRHHRQRQPELCVGGQFRRGAQRHPHRRRADLHRQPSGRVQLQLDSNERQRGRRGRQRHDQPCDDHRLRVEREQQRVLAHAHLGCERNGPVHGRLYRRRQYRRRTQRQSDGRRDYVHGHSGGALDDPLGNSERHGARVWQPEGRYDQHAQECGSDQQRWRHADGRLDIRGRTESG